MPHFEERGYAFQTNEKKSEKANKNLKFKI